MKKIILIITSFLILVGTYHSQIIVSQNFEGPFPSSINYDGTKWFRSSTPITSLVSSAGNLTPYEGTTCISLSSSYQAVLKTPYFEKLAGLYKLSFWYHAPYPQVFFEIKLYDTVSSTSLLTLNTNLDYNNTWEYKEFFIPSGYIGNYYLNFRSSYDEIYIDDISLVAQNSTKTNENNNLVNQIKLYPNPSSNGIININIADLETTYLNVFDVSGKQVFNSHLNKKNTQIDLSHLTKGVYYAKFQIKNQVVTKKIILK